MYCGRLPTFLNSVRRKLGIIFWGITLLGICVIYIMTSVNEQQVIPSHQQHALCVLVPIRDVFEELTEFVPHMSEFLNRQGIRYHIIMIQQNDEYRFNRAALFNIGFQRSTKDHPDCDYVALHDIDLLPLNDEISYAYPEDSVFHVAAPEYHPTYHSKSYIGGILLVANSVYVQADGMTNKCWGWGAEDNEFYARLAERSIEIKRPRNLSTNKSTTFRHIHGQNRKRDLRKCKGQLLARKNRYYRDRMTGVRNVEYEVVSFHSLTVGNFPYDLYNVNLTCDKALTPWCICK